MAGIGFRIEKILKEDTYLASLKAHFYSTLICSGPWLLSIITIFVLSYFVPKNIDFQQILYFRTTIIYVFAFSLIVVGILYLSLSRYLADKLYLKEEEALAPAFNSSALFVLCLQALIGWIIFHKSDHSSTIVILSILIYLVISLIWLVMIFLTALKDYQSIIIAYAQGTVVAIVAALWLGSEFHLEGYFAGYLIGHLLIAALLSARILIEFPSKRIFDWHLFTALAHNKTLIFTGVFYNTAIWIDKMVFWVTPVALRISPVLRSFPEYEIANFFAYLTIIPALSIFLIHVETSFYNKYRLFYAQILERGTYWAIRRAKSDMADSLRSSFARLVVYQGMITLLVITFASELIMFAHLKAVLIPIFRVMALGAYLHSLLLITIIIILYFDLQKLAAGITFTFMITNCLFTYVTATMKFQYLGYGYFFSALISLMLAFYFIDFKFRRLEYLTFALQPLGEHREEEIA